MCRPNFTRFLRQMFQNPENSAKCRKSDTEEYLENILIRIKFDLDKVRQLEQKSVLTQSSTKLSCAPSSPPAETMTSIGRPSCQQQRQQKLECSRMYLVGRRGLGESPKATPTGGWYQSEPCMHTFSVKFSRIFTYIRKSVEKNLTDS